MWSSLLFVFLIGVLRGGASVQPPINCSSFNRLGKSLRSTLPPRSCQLQAAAAVTGRRNSRYTQQTADNWCEEAGSDYPWLEIQDYLARSSETVRRQLQQFSENNIRYLREKYGRSLEGLAVWRKRRRRSGRGPVTLQDQVQLHSQEEAIEDAEDLEGTSTSSVIEPVGETISSEEKSTTPSVFIDDQHDPLDVMTSLEESSGDVDDLVADDLPVTPHEDLLEVYDDDAELAVLHTPYTDPSGVVVTKQIFKRIFSNAKQSKLSRQESDGTNEKVEKTTSKGEKAKPEPVPSYDNEVETTTQPITNKNDDDSTEAAATNDQTTSTNVPHSLSASPENEADTNIVESVQSRISPSSDDDTIFSEVQYYVPGVGQVDGDHHQFVPVAEKFIQLTPPDVHEFRRKTTVFSASGSSTEPIPAVVNGEGADHKDDEFSRDETSVGEESKSSAGRLEQHVTEVEYAGESISTTAATHVTDMSHTTASPVYTTARSTGEDREPSTIAATASTTAAATVTTTTRTANRASTDAARRSTSRPSTTSSSAIPPSSPGTTSTAPVYEIPVTRPPRPTTTADPYVRPACASLIEIRSPFYALNTQHEWKTLINMPPFESFIHMEHCNSEGVQGGCAANCVCKQRFTIRTMPVYDRDSQGCDTIYMDKFLFPSHCDCMCLSNVYTVFTQPTATTPAVVTDSSIVFPGQQTPASSPAPSGQSNEEQNTTNGGSVVSPASNNRTMLHPTANSVVSNGTSGQDIPESFSQPDTHLPVPPRVPIVTTDLGGGGGEDAGELGGETDTQQSHRNKNRGPALSPLPRYIVDKKLRKSQRGGRALPHGSPR